MAEHYCSEHNTEYFRKGNMKGYAHPIGDTKQWCNEVKTKPPGAIPQATPEVGVPPDVKVKEPNYRNPINRSVSLRYAVDLHIAGKIELKDLAAYADKFAAYMEKVD